MLSDHKMKILEIDPGNKVICDNCSKDYTESNKQGGIISMGRAVCPDCCKRWTSRIELKCPEWLSFAVWVRIYRFK